MIKRKIPKIVFCIFLHLIFFCCAKEQNNKDKEFYNSLSFKNRNNYSKTDSSFKILHKETNKIMYLERFREMPDIWHGLKFSHDNCYGSSSCNEIITIGRHKHNLSKAIGDTGTKTELDSAYYISTKKCDYLIIRGCFFIPNKGVCAFIHWLVFQDPTQKHGFYKFYGIANAINSTDCLGDFDNDGFLDIINNNYDDDISKAKFISIYTEKQILQEKVLFLKHSSKRLNEMDSVASFLPFDIIDLKRSKHL